MASLVTRLVLAMVVIAGTLMFGNVRVSAQCGGSIPQLVAQCSQFVKKEGPQIPPSSGCCSAVKAADVPCVCALVTPAIEKIISMEKVVYVARTCGVTVKPGTKCGSYTVPPKRLI
ncbi:AAI domain-containing protein [Citrus sinensis]|uniref:AAI domain-containing protein n=1 Tax=Citrus sinensis TaxID=2711 RepID=A0ACB8MXJ0_CITSI|nr:AAI domain-containing protein [Citrus sinensis]